MKTIYCLAAAIVLAACTSTYAADGIIRNDVVWQDVEGKEIWSNGGHIIREGDLFYWVGYDTGPGRWPWKINLYSSRNLADWKFENTLMRMEGKFGQMGWAGRPALLHCKSTGKYIIIFEADSPRQWTRHKVGFAVCDRIDGKYELASAEYPEAERSTGDQSVYQEGDKAYVLATMDKDINGRKYMNQSLAIFELSKDFLRIERKVFEGFDNVSGDRKALPREHSSREASHIIKVGDTYYWFSSALVGWNSSATTYATAKDLAGPWSELKVLRTEPPSNDSYNTQHDFVFPVVGGETTTWVYAGDRYSQWTKRGTGRNIFLPLLWEDGAPVLRWQKDWKIDVISGRFAAAGAIGKIAPKPLFRDPVHDGAADPVVIWNRHEGKWLMFYTNRRANVADAPGVSWVHGTRIGIAESSDDGATWKYRGTAKVNYGKEDYSHWAPEVIEQDGTYHMFLSIVPGTFKDWNAPRDIIHLTSKDLLKWEHRSTLKLASDRVIDACVLRLPSGTWRLWYNNERDRKSIYYADSQDLYDWQDRGKAIGDQPGEGPKVFHWRGRYWMVVDVWNGLGIYRSQDAMKWTRQRENLLEKPGTGEDDQVKGGHPDVVVSGDRAFLFYFTHPGRKGEAAKLDGYEQRRSSIQVVELEEQDGRITCDRDKPTRILLNPSAQKN